MAGRGHAGTEENSPRVLVSSNVSFPTNVYFFKHLNTKIGANSCRPSCRLTPRCPKLLDTQLGYIDFAQLTVTSGAVPTPAPVAPAAPEPAPVATPEGGTPGTVPLTPIACFPEQIDSSFGDDGGYYAVQAAETSEDEDVADDEVRASRWQGIVLPPTGRDVSGGVPNCDGLDACARQN